MCFLQTNIKGSNDLTELTIVDDFMRNIKLTTFSRFEIFVIETTLSVIQITFWNDFPEIWAESSKEKCVYFIHLRKCWRILKKQNKCRKCCLSDPLVHNDSNIWKFLYDFMKPHKKFNTITQKIVKNHIIYLWL
jgi:hypothetical protein